MAGIPQPTLTRQVQNDNLTVENVVKLARAFSVKVPDALVWHGIVEAEELSVVTIAGTLLDATDQQLLDEISRRLAEVEEGKSVVFDSLPTNGSDATVHHVEFGMDDHRAVASHYSEDRGEDDGYDA